MKPAAVGLVVTNPGGWIGWLSRRLFPFWSTQTYLKIVRLTHNRPARNFIRGFRQHPAPPLFSHVEIETLNRCNGSCDFCPVNKYADPRTPARMTEDLFSQLIDQLAALDYAGYLGLFSNNEPLLDNRLVDFAAEARQKLPHASLNLSTNGKLLEIDLFRRLLPHFDRIVINNYNDKPHMHPKTQALHDFCSSADGRRLTTGKTVEISLRGSHDILSTRAGTAPNRTRPEKVPSSPCILPYTQMIVRPDGKISLCCNDALGQVTLGDATRETLMDIWTGEKFTAVRQAMAEQGRVGLPLCSRCDFIKQTV